jgi:hypothetical protein
MFINYLHGPHHLILEIIIWSFYLNFKLLPLTTTYGDAIRIGFSGGNMAKGVGCINGTRGIIA